jgi:dolichol-phosphate mannosyltransferase
MEQPKISFVSPVYLAEHMLDKLVDEICKVMEKLNESFEIILVDDRSPDNSWEVMKCLSTKYKEVKCIRLSRNFGQHPAIMAGLTHAKGEWIVVMDCDLQDQPKEVEKLYNKALEGFDVVLAKRILRQDSFLKKLSSKIFSKVYGFFTNTSFDGTVANFGVYSSKVIKSIVNMNDYIISFPLFVNWVGFDTVAIEVEHSVRESGKSSYTYSKLIELAFNTIISFSNKPLKLFVKYGLLISFVSFLMGVYTLFKYLMGEISVLGYSSLMVSIWFLSGVIISVIGVVGIYIGKIFDQAKQRPSFIIDRFLDND